MIRASVRRPRVVLSGAVALVLAAGLGPGPVRSQEPPQQDPDAPQRPIFRLGTDVVRLDVYPRRRGEVVTGLSKDEFQVFEDGQSQVIETFEFIEFEGWGSGGEELDPRTPREALRMAADGRNRVFVLFLDTYHVTREGALRARDPILRFLRDGLGPRDLFGVLTPAQAPELLTLGRLTNEVASAMTLERTWGLLDTPVQDPDEMMLMGCPSPSRGWSLLQLWRFDRVLSTLEGLIVHLSAIREERKNILLVSDRWPDALRLRRSPAPLPVFGVERSLGYAATTDGQRGRGSFGLPRGGLFGNEACAAEGRRLSGIDFWRRLQELPELARAANVAFYVLPPGTRTLFNDPSTQFRGLAEDTDGLSIVTNDLFDGLGRALDHQTGYYMLGYRSTSDPGDRRPRRIEVKTSRRGIDLELRREYYPPPPPEERANGEPAERSDVERALDALERIRDTTSLFVHAAARQGSVEVTAEIAAAVMARGGWRQAADLDVVVRDGAGAEIGRGSAQVPSGYRSARATVELAGDGIDAARVDVRVSGPTGTLSEFVDVQSGSGPVLGALRAFRAGSLPSMPFQPAAEWQFERTERVRVEWPLGGAAEEPAVRVLNAAGEERLVDATLTVIDGEPAILRADLRLLSLAPADYALEVTARQGEASDRQLIAFRVLR